MIRRCTQIGADGEKDGQTHAMAGTAMTARNLNAPRLTYAPLASISRPRHNHESKIFYLRLSASSAESSINFHFVS